MRAIEGDSEYFECGNARRGDGRVNAVMGWDADGRPLDPGHWWNGEGAFKHGKRKAK